MNVYRNDLEGGWIAISIGLTLHEIDKIIILLQRLKENPDEHFHLGSTFDDESRVSDIEFSVKSKSTPDNMVVLGTAIKPNR